MLNNRILCYALIKIKLLDIKIDLPNSYLASIALIHLLLFRFHILIYLLIPKLYRNLLFKIIELTQS